MAAAKDAETKATEQSWVKKQKVTALLEATKAGEVEMVRRLLAAMPMQSGERISVNRQERDSQKTALMLAVQAGNSQLVGMLVAKKAPIAGRTSMWFHFADLRSHLRDGAWRFRSVGAVLGPW